MSIVATRPPLEQIGMNGQKRRSARLSQENEGEAEYPAKKSRHDGGSSTTTTNTTTVSTKQSDGEPKSNGRKKNKVYDEKVDDFTFSKGKRKQTSKENGRRAAATQATAEAPPALPSEEPVPAAAAAAAEPAAEPAITAAPVPAPTPSEPTARTAQKKTRRRLPTTPERDTAAKPVRRSKRLSNENNAQTSPKAADQVQPQVAPDRSPTPDWVQPVTIEKKRKQVGDSVEEEKTKRFVLSFADTPIIQRNKQMRKGSGDGRRRSSSGMRGKRASSLIDEGRGNALPHSEVPTAEFFKHISAELPEPRRMRCLIGWCGTRALPVASNQPTESSPPASLEFQALQTARSIMEELSQDLISKGTISDWFGRDDSEPLPKPLRKKPNPRNLTNTTKVQELEQELERLKRERSEWEEVVKSGEAPTSPPSHDLGGDVQLSPLHAELLDSPQRAIAEQLRSSNAGPSSGVDVVQDRLRSIAEDLEHTVDLFAHGVHTMSTARDTAERVADRTLADAAKLLEDREAQRTRSGKAVDQIDALRGLARILNTQYRRP